MVSELLIIYILLVHYLGDFPLQTQEQALEKSTNDKMLFYHTGTYSLIWWIAASILFNNIFFAFVFALITFSAHSVTDAITSRIGKIFWDKKDTHNGFVVVGFDQILHYLQLYYTYKLIIYWFNVIPLF